MTNPAKPFPCPICKKPTHWQENEFRPFCSDRCRQIDLGNWYSDQYAITGEDDDTTSGDWTPEDEPTTS